MTTYVLIHGAWMGAWVWKDTTTQLIKLGNKVITPDLYLSSSLCFNKHILSLAELIKNQDEKVILLGHSMSGMIISALAEIIPDRIQLLIYLGAYLPENQESIFDIIRKLNIKTKVKLKFSSNNSLCMVEEKLIDKCFFNSTSQQYIKYAKQLMLPQSVKYLLTKVTLTANNFGLTNKIYIKCTKDNVIPIKSQEKMIKRQAILSSIKIDSDHCPFFSAPTKLIYILKAIGKNSN